MVGIGDDDIWWALVRTTTIYGGHWWDIWCIGDDDIWWALVDDDIWWALVATTYGGHW